MATPGDKARDTGTPTDAPGAAPRRNKRRKPATTPAATAAPAPPPKAATLQAVALGLLPAGLLLLALAATDYLASRLFYASAYATYEERWEEDADADYVEHAVDDSRFYAFDGSDEFARDAYQGANLVQAWPTLDPLVRTRIWLRSLYPLPRAEAGRSATDVSRLLGELGLGERYPGVHHLPELFAKAVGSGRGADFETVLRALRQCQRAGTCAAGNTVVQVSALVEAAYVQPTIDLLGRGHCPRAAATIATGGRLLDVLDVGRKDESALAGVVWLLTYFADHPRCQQQFEAIGATVAPLKDWYEPLTAVDFSRLPDPEFAELHAYEAAARAFSLGVIDVAHARFDALRASPSPAMAEMAAFMQIRCVFWSVVYGRNPRLYTGEVAEPGLRPLPIEVAAATAAIRTLSPQVRRESLRGDILEYELELAKYGGGP